MLVQMGTYLNCFMCCVDWWCCSLKLKPNPSVIFEMVVNMCFGNQFLGYLPHLYQLNSFTADCYIASVFVLGWCKLEGTLYFSQTFSHSRNFASYLSSPLYRRFYHCNDQSNYQLLTSIDEEIVGICYLITCITCNLLCN